MTTLPHLFYIHSRKGFPGLTLASIGFKCSTKSIQGIITDIKSFNISNSCFRHLFQIEISDQKSIVSGDVDLMNHTEVFLDKSILTSVNRDRNQKGSGQNINKMVLKESIHFSARIGCKLINPNIQLAIRIFVSMDLISK